MRLTEDLKGRFFTHIGKGGSYKVIDDSEEITVKQTEDNQWEFAVIYQNTVTYQTFITGKKRFLNRFIETKEVL